MRDKKWLLAVIDAARRPSRYTANAGDKRAALDAIAHGAPREMVRLRRMRSAIAVENAESRGFMSAPRSVSNLPR